jgi:hypothetical protein
MMMMTMMMMLHHLRLGRQENHATNHARCAKKEQVIAEGKGIVRLNKVKPCVSQMRAQQLIANVLAATATAQRSCSS